MTRQKQRNLLFLLLSQSSITGTFTPCPTIEFIIFLYLDIPLLSHHSHKETSLQDISPGLLSHSSLMQSKMSHYPTPQITTFIHCSLNVLRTYHSAFTLPNTICLSHIVVLNSLCQLSSSGTLLSFLTIP